MIGLFSAKRLYAAGGVAILAALALTWSYDRGRKDCAARHARIAAEAQAKAAEAEAAAIEEAYQRGLQAARRAEARRQGVEDVRKNAETEARPDGVCVSADTVERLRQLRSRS